MGVDWQGHRRQGGKAQVSLLLQGSGRDFKGFTSVTCVSQVLLVSGVSKVETLVPGCASKKQDRTRFCGFTGCLSSTQLEDQDDAFTDLSGSRPGCWPRSLVLLQMTFHPPKAGPDFCPARCLRVIGARWLLQGFQRSQLWKSQCCFLHILLVEASQAATGRV